MPATFIGPLTHAQAITADSLARNDVRFGHPTTIAPGVTREFVYSFNGRSTWGYRVTCAGCGLVDVATHCSSVTSEDGPPRFAYEHRGCNT